MISYLVPLDPSIKYTIVYLRFVFGYCCQNKEVDQAPNIRLYISVYLSFKVQ